MWKNMYHCNYSRKVQDWCLSGMVGLITKEDQPIDLR